MYMIPEWLQITLVILPALGICSWLVWSFHKDGFDGLKSFEKEDSKE